MGWYSLRASPSLNRGIGGNGGEGMRVGLEGEKGGGCQQVVKRFNR